MGNLKKTSSVTALVSAETINANLKGKSSKELAEILLKELSLDVKDCTPEQREAKILRRKLICETLGISVKTTDQFLNDLKKYIIDETEKPTQDYPSILKKENSENIQETVGKAIEVASKFIPELNIVKVIYAGLQVIINGVQDHKDNSHRDAEKIEALKVFMKKVATLNSELDSEIITLTEHKKTMTTKEFSKFKKERLLEIRKRLESKHGVKLTFEEENGATEDGAPHIEPEA